MAGDATAKDLTAKDMIANKNAEFPLDMDQNLFQALLMELLAMDRNTIRERAAKNTDLKAFISSPRFLLEFARMTGCSDRLPPMEYIQKQMADGFFTYKKSEYTISLIDYVFDKTRHGFAQKDFPFDANHGVKAVSDAGECSASCDLRNIFCLENMNVPVCRFDPNIFCQSWMLALLRPKFVFRGLAACPKGDYGLCRFIVEVGNTKGNAVRSEVSVPFRSGDDSRIGRFIPFEVVSPEYDFRPNHVFFFVCVFYVNQTEMPVRGMRVANCTVQCVLPPMPPTLENVECNDSFPSGNYDAPPHSCNYSIDDTNEPTYLKELKKDFYSVIKNSADVRKAETDRAQDDIDRILGGNLLEEKMDVEEIGADKRKRENTDEDEPLAKKRNYQF
ncbi:hypothetical protein CAEBREN_31374 [Caenorhabditis brenneri]|uniref:Uncharacterized protein n=1 Tax=Caenorhabditis brenneri TaxID=135651 RepID=G0NWF3_CAEBE|nr:hypothetical protein CAEBREN_31374 [Caenorhabditis brenneri]